MGLKQIRRNGSESIAERMQREQETEGALEPLSTPQHSLDLDLLAGPGIQIVSTVSGAILDLIASRKLEDESATINGLTRTKTNADRISNNLFKEMLLKEFPEMAILSEETRANGVAGPKNVPSDQVYAVVDPIDGTTHLKEGDGQWLLNLGFCLDGEALVGISAIPAENKLYLGAKGKPSIEMSLDGTSPRELPQIQPREKLVFGICSPLDLGGDQERVDRWKKVAEINGATETREFGSAISYLKVADGTIDAFVNLGGNFHWDTVAQQVILEGTGARLVDIDWDVANVQVSTAPPCRYGLHFIKDDGHIAARPDLTVKLDPNLRMQWKPAFD